MNGHFNFIFSDEYPHQNYLQQLYEALLKIGIDPPSILPPLPSNAEAHHGESSDDEEEEKKLEVLKKGGPFKQPDKGMIRFEKCSANLKGSTHCGTIKVYARFAGGKMKIEVFL